MATVTIIIVQIILSCSIASNTLPLFMRQFSLLNVSSGVDESHLAWMDFSNAGGDFNALDIMEGLKDVPGINSVSRVNAAPLSGRTWIGQIGIGDDGRDIQGVSIYFGTYGIVNTFGSKLISGRDFLPEEYREYDILKNANPPKTSIVTKAFADAAWPGMNPIGKSIRFAGSQVEVIGVVDALVAPSFKNPKSSQLSIVFPVKSMAGGIFAIRALSLNKDLLQTIKERIKTVDPLIKLKTFTTFNQAKSDYYRNTWSMIYLLASVVLMLLAITAFGVAGVCSYWIQKRVVTIGIQRALGATKNDILFQIFIEVFCVSGIGVCGGIFGSIGISALSMTYFESPHITFFWLLVNSAIFLLTALSACYGPAKKAASISPFSAMRQGNR